MATVPNVLGDTLTAASAAIVASGLTVGTISKIYSTTVAINVVTFQSIIGGATESAGTPINLQVSLGPQFPQTLRAIKIAQQKTNHIHIQFTYSPLGLL